MLKCKMKDVQGSDKRCSKTCHEMHLHEPLKDVKKLYITRCHSLSCGVLVICAGKESCLNLVKIEVSGFRSFIDKTSIDNLGQINVFVGRNNAGKTNIIEILRLLNSLMSGSPYRKPVDFISKGHNRMLLTTEFALEDDERTKLIKRFFKDAIIHPDEVLKSKFLRKVTHSLDVAPQGIEEETVSTMNTVNGDVVVWGQFRNKQTNQVESKGCDLLGFCQQLKRLTENLSVELIVRAGFGQPATWESLWHAGLKEPDLLPKMIREIYERIDWAPPNRQSETAMTPQEARKLTPNGSNLPQVWNTIVSDDPRELVKLGEEIQRLVGISSINAPVRGNQTTPGFKESTDMSFDMANTSSGIQQAAILVTKIGSCPPGAILLVEEPESHLHAGAQRVLREILRTHSKKIQFFISSHSTLFANFATSSNLYLVTREEAQSHVRLLLRPEDLKAIKKELGHRNLDLYGYDVVVFVEGESEETALPIIADSRGVDFAEKGILLQNLKGAGKVQKLGQYLEYLRGSSTIPFLVADGSGVVKEKIADWEGAHLLPKGNYRMWNVEFEDLFPPELVAQSLSKMGYTGFTAEILARNLGGRSVVHAIEKVLNETDQRSLDKPALAETLAEEVVRTASIPKELVELVEVLAKLG